MCSSKLRVGMCVLIFMRDTEHALDPHWEASEEFTEAVLDRPQATRSGRSVLSFMNDRSTAVQRPFSFSF